MGTLWTRTSLSCLLCICHKVPWLWQIHFSHKLSRKLCSTSSYLLKKIRATFLQHKMQKQKIMWLSRTVFSRLVLAAHTFSALRLAQEVYLSSSENIHTLWYHVKEIQERNTEWSLLVTHSYLQTPLSWKPLGGWQGWSDWFFSTDPQESWI